MIGNPNNPRRDAVRKAQDRDRGGMSPADWDAAEPVGPPYGTRAHADAESLRRYAQRFMPARLLDAIGGP